MQVVAVHVLKTSRLSEQNPLFISAENTALSTSHYQIALIQVFAASA
ncbi:Glucose-1-phosphate adenylyltransferase [Yersinia kristensenii ATCC 33638]|nr:Glucose-1-phosphate adenylyltransferase [Yersinia kristensenii ATCC 33638]